LTIEGGNVGLRGVGTSVSFNRDREELAIFEAYRADSRGVEFKREVAEYLLRKNRARKVQQGQVSQPNSPQKDKRFPGKGGGGGRQTKNKGRRRGGSF